MMTTTSTTISSKRYFAAAAAIVACTQVIFMLNTSGLVVAELNPVLDINGTYPYLINKTDGQIIEPRNYMDFDNIYTPDENYKNQQTAQGKNYHMLKAFDFANYFQSDYWHYSNEEDLKLSAYPVANKDKCELQLNWLESKLNISGILFKSGEQHVNLMTYLDSFGKPESATFLGHGYWLGSHYECKRVFIDMEKFEQEECRLNNSTIGCNQQEKLFEATEASTKIKARYCMGKARDVDWPSEQKDDYMPRISYKIGLCLPETCETLSLVKHKDQIERLMRINLPDYLKSRIQLDDMYCLPDARSPVRALSLSAKIYLSICIAWLIILLLATNISGSPATIRILKALSITESIREFSQPPALLRSPEAIEKIRINLNALDFIKCLCCVLVIFGHIVFIHMQHLSNIVHTIELSYEIYPRVLIAFFNFVDTFFIISGMLTAYFIFKRFDKQTFANPLIWLQISFFRLLRLSPVYLLVFWFTKTLTVHLSDGPIWDYGTDNHSIKGLCINDHWWKSLLYLGNVGTMQPHCILPAWSIIVDSQYSIIVPPILFLILKHKKLGYLSLLIAVIVSTANMSHQLATQTAVKTSDMAKIRLHVYPLISRFAAEFYNTPWNRIGPVAIGILGGHMLYLYDIAVIRRWPWFMRGVAFKLVMYLHLFIFIIPTIGKFTDNPESTNETDMTIFVLSNATLKPIWSLINTIFLLRIVTDLRLSSSIARVMSNNIWHCLGKLCFASYLIHYEVILILLKSRNDGLVDPNWPNVLREFSVAFLISTVISYFIYILFEAPINKLITLAMAKPEQKKSQEEKSIDIV